MKIKHIFAHILPFLALMLSAVILSGCKTAEAAQEQEPDESAAKVENAEDQAAEVATESAAEPEEQTAKKDRKKKEQSATADNGPGDVPAPTDETKDKLEEMEDSLAPIKTIPTAPKT